MNGDENDEGHARTLAKRLREDCRPLCPQFRSCHLERLYPVEGYCILDRSPGRFMIPSIEEYREYCTRPRFADCCWFRWPGETDGSVKDQPGQHPTRVTAR